MSRFFSAGLAAIAVASLAACSDAPDAVIGNEPEPPQSVALSNGAQGEQVMAGEVLVKVKNGVDVADVARGRGLSVGEHGYREAFVILRGAAGAEHANANALKSDSRVEWAEPNYLRRPTVDPKLWAFKNPGGLNMLYSRGGSAGQPISSSYASTVDADEDNIDDSFGAGGAAVVIGSIDTGVDFTHTEFLAGQLIKGQDWYSNDTDPTDTDGHGTHTTGTMVGRTVGIAGVSGAGLNVKVYVQRVCGQRGCPTAAIINAINAAANYGVVAMNLSLGGPSESQGEKDAIAYALSKNALVIASAGNDGSGTVSCPACDPNAISVLASNWKDQKTSYSQYGSGLDIGAPGGECYSNTTPEGCIYSSYKGGGYEWLQGTSMAAPQVTGTAGVAASKNSTLRGNAAALRSQLLNTADAVTGLSSYGVKRLNTYRAVTGTTLTSPN
ncbi:MAG TPA: S8 family serine peptidase [Gemmatimonadaceae bacterium]|nr:S8 family serine peptidase [Gemmatimonadaceae bacterium]